MLRVDTDVRAGWALLDYFDVDVRFVNLVNDELRIVCSQRRHICDHVNFADDDQPFLGFFSAVDTKWFTGCCLDNEQLEFWAQRRWSQRRSRRSTCRDCGHTVDLPEETAMC